MSDELKEYAVGLRAHLEREEAKAQEQRDALEHTMDTVRRLRRAVDALDPQERETVVEAARAPRRNGNGHKGWTPSEKKRAVVLEAMREARGRGPLNVVEIAAVADVSHETVRRSLDYLRDLPDPPVRLVGVDTAKNNAKLYELMPNA